MKKILYTLLIVPLLGFAQDENPCYSINDIFIQMDGENPSLEVNLVAGWNMIGYPCTQDMLLTDGFSLVDDKISMVKNNNGAVYIPEFNFNGIGFLESGQGYQVKMNEFVMGFSFCESVQYPNLEGCTDCEAVNFNQWANVDDGSCNYDSDGDGVPDSEEVVGCQDSMACDYDETATDSGECSYAQEGYDCDGNSLIYLGAEAYGGIVFYYDSIGEYGLVAAMEDIEGTYEWGCYETDLAGADGQAIGTGYQNTIDIVAGCSETPIAASEALAYESDGYSDWFLPSKDELITMCQNIWLPDNSFTNFINEWYWSSSKSTNLNSWLVQFQSGTEGDAGTHATYNVRPIRAIGNWTMGCMDSLACNYNPEANMADRSCEYAEQLYDCDGNLTEEIEGPICGYLPTNIDIWPYIDINIPGGYTVHSVYADFDRPGYSGSTLDYSIAYCSNCDSFPAFIDNLSEFYIWEYETISYSLYDTELVISEVSEIELNGPGTIRVLAPLSNDGWNDFCINFELYGCMDSLACNFNSEANMSDGSCEYAELGYDCEGNITEYIVGMEAEGGIVFYVDETGERGLVAAAMDIFKEYADSIGYTYEWGCLSEYVSGADGQAIGTGYQNTMDIVNQGCDTENGGITAAQAALDAEINGYSDWYLPSKDELYEMKNTIGQEGSDGNIGGFSSSSYWSSSEYNSSNAWSVYSNGGGTGSGRYKLNTFRVRPIRAFGYTVGCMDSLACNFNPEANMSDGSCEYADLGYDCDGNFVEYVVGMEAEGGIVFYVDETGEHGLVAAMEDLTEGATDPYGWGYNSYEWGCYGQGVNGADGTSIGTGYQNTIDIVNQGCSTDNGGITAAQAALDAEINGYSDWYLPSQDELVEMYNTIGNGSPEGNIGGFENNWYWSSSEYSNNYAWTVPFGDGYPGNYDKHYTSRVRVIRAF